MEKFLDQLLTAQIILSDMKKKIEILGVKELQKNLEKIEEESFKAYCTDLVQARLGSKL
jgi:hypothetical protein